MEIKAVIFDLDGTLYDNSKLAAYLVSHSLLHLKYLYAERICRHRMSGRYFGRHGETYDELFSRMAEVSGKSVDKCRRWYWGRYMPLQVRALKSKFHAKPWVSRTLAELRDKGILLACFSEYSFVREKLSALGINPDSFDFIIDAPSAGGCKPCRKAMLYVSGKLRVHPSSILVVGDREDTDGAGAEAAGMHFLLVPRADSDKLDLSGFGL